MEVVIVHHKKKHFVFVAGNADTQLKSYRNILLELNKLKHLKLSVIYNSNFLGKQLIKPNNKIEKEIFDIVDDLYIYKPQIIKIPIINFLNDLFMAFDYQLKIFNYFEGISPDLIIIPNNKIFRNRFIYKYASMNNIDTIVIQDTLNPGGFGNINGYSKKVKRKILTNRFLGLILNSLAAVRFFGFKSIFKFNKGHENINKIAVWGKTSQKIALANSYNANQIVVTGAPRFDEIINKDWNDISTKLYQNLKIGQKGKKIVFLPSKGILSEYFATRDEQLKIYDGLTEAVINVSKSFNVPINLIIKLHREEDSSVIQDILPSKIIENVTIVQGDVLYPLLYKCDVAITTASTAGLEALIFDKPLITINFSKMPDFYNYVATGSAIGVYQLNEIEPALIDALFRNKKINELKANRRKYLFDEVYLNDGNSSSRVCLMLKETSNIL